jgi:CheY-like chemotaxis protein
MTALQHLGLQNRHAHDLGFINVLVAGYGNLEGIMLQRVLTGWKANVTLAHTGAEAISKASETDFDLILTDFQMPDMDGFEAAEQMNKRPSHTAPIIAVTGLVSISAPKLKAAGISDCLHKPYSTEELFDAIDRHMQHELKLVGW